MLSLGTQFLNQIQNAQWPVWLQAGHGVPDLELAFHCLQYGTPQMASSPSRIWPGFPTFVTFTSSYNLFLKDSVVNAGAVLH